MLNTGKLAGKTLYVTGASRGIGKAVALKAARDGANVVVAAKTAEPHPKLPGTIYTAAKESSESGTWFIDLKNGGGSVGSGEPTTGSADCTFTLKDSDFISMFQGKLKPTNAFMTGKLKLAGDMGKAMALEKMMKKMNARGYHTMSGPHFMTRHLRMQGSLSKAAGLESVIEAIGLRSYSSSVDDDTPLVYENVPQVFDRISAICSPEIVKTINSIFVFDIDGVDKYFLDFKNGDGKVGTGDPGQKPDVFIKMNEEVSLKIFNRELKPATAFMTGQIKLRGDLAKAFALEKIMAAARDEALARRKTSQK